MSRATRRYPIAPSVRIRPRFRRPKNWLRANSVRSEARDVSGYIATNPVPRSRTHKAEVPPRSPRDEEDDAMT
eukprot:7985017-Alexandrium_andersonii.AAC.1